MHVLAYRDFRCVFVLMVVLLLGGLPASRSRAEEAKNRSDASADSTEAIQRLFVLHIAPMLKGKCLGCHGADPEDLKGAYDVRTRAALLAGGESGDVAIVEGAPDDSPLYHAIRWDGLEMPPKENDRLTSEQIAMFRRWIASGAPWPDEQEQAAIRKAEWSVPENEDGILVSTSGGLSDEWTYRRYQPPEVWAFQPVATQFAFDSIDAFVNDRLREVDLEPAPPAGPRQLVRRAFFDLVGLPPDPEEQQAFLEAWESDPERAWSDLIDRLLASPHYGERWAQHWLDVVRYADTAGFSNDYERSNAWRYRDYVIRSLNDDKPYDLFVQEQIAGDELRPGDPEGVIATGFLRMGPWGTAMIPQEEARQLYRDDVVHSIGQAFLSLPMRCCKCHDHKFDPVPTRDYYRMYAAVSASQPAEMAAEFLDEENRADFESERTFVHLMWEYAKSRRDALYEKREAAARQWYAENNLPYKTHEKRKNDPEDKKPKRHCGLTATEQGRLKVREQDTWIWERRKERFEPLAQSVFNGPDRNQNAKKLRPPQSGKKGKNPSNKTAENASSGAPIVSHIFLGGSYQAKGDKVTPGVLSACNIPVPGAPTDDPYALPTTLQGRRLALARWITDPGNPLTGRSIVNRIWQHHFGNGIVRTANNFGVKGASPTHRDLLDFLTHDFVQNGWKIKRMHKMIMMSDAYRRSTVHPDKKAVETVDPANHRLARFQPRRLTAEEVRDGLLKITGEWNQELGGLPVRPEINQEVALEPRMIQFSIAPAYQPSPTPAQRNRRSIYAYRIRGQSDPFLEVLNKPNSNESCDHRDTAAVSPQAFTLFNSDVMSDRSIALALRLEKEAPDVPSRITRAFQLTLGHTPSTAETRRLTHYIEQMKTYHENHPAEPVDYPTEITRSLVEEFTGQEFEYQERLPVYEDYTADTKPDAVPPETRALADMCLVLLNTNEFIYVY